MGSMVSVYFVLLAAIVAAFFMHKISAKVTLYN